MNDLISKDKLFASLRDVKRDVMRGGQRIPNWNDAVAVIGGAQIVDAIPVQWINELMLNGEPEESKAAWRIIKAWKKYKGV